MFFVLTSISIFTAEKESKSAITINAYSSSDNFLDAVPQSSDARKIAEELTSKNSINISRDLRIYNPNHITSTSNFITLLDFERQEFKFHLFNHSLEKTGAFGNSGRGPGEFKHPMSITRDVDENYLIADLRLNRISKFSDDGTHLDDTNTPFGINPFRFEGMGDSKNFVILSLIGDKIFHIINEEGELLNSFLSIEGVSMNQKGFLLDGRIAADNDVIYHAGLRNDMLKAFTKDGELLFSRKVIAPLGLDSLNMEDQEVRSSPVGVLDLTIHENKILMLFGGQSDDNNRWYYLDIYDKNDGEYLYTYLMDRPTNRISIPEKDSSQWFFLGFDIDNTDERILSSYDSLYYP